jgi:hypothetical protein
MTTPYQSVVKLTPNYRRKQRNRYEQRRQGNFYAFGARTDSDAEHAGWGLPHPGAADGLVERRPGGLPRSGDHDGGYDDGHHVPGAAVDLALAVPFADTVPDHLAMALPFGVPVSDRFSERVSLRGRPE